MSASDRGEFPSGGAEYSTRVSAPIREWMAHKRLGTNAFETLSNKIETSRVAADGSVRVLLSDGELIALADVCHRVLTELRGDKAGRGAVMSARTTLRWIARTRRGEAGR